MPMYLILNDDGRGSAVGYDPYIPVREYIETTESKLSEVFENADADALAGTRDTPDGEDDPIEAAIGDPLAYRDYLILVNGEIVFDDEYARDVNDEDGTE